MRAFPHSSPAPVHDGVITVWADRRRARLVVGLIPAAFLIAPLVPFTSAWCSDHFALWLLGSVALVAASASSTSLGDLARCPHCEAQVPGLVSPPRCPHCGVALK